MFTASALCGEAMAEYYAEFGSLRYMQGQEVNAGVNMIAIERLADLRTIRTLLDVGAGYGFLLQRLRDRGISVIGVEPSIQEAKYGVDNLGVDIRPCMLAEAGLPYDFFDLVVALEVIEHIPEPQRFVEELAKYVRPGGAVVIGTDNFESGVAKAMGPAFPKWIPDCHVSHFSPDTLSKCIESAGLRVERAISYTPWENCLQGLRSRFRRKPSAQECFSFHWPPSAATEREYPLFALRRRVNPLWVRMTCGSRVNGAMMYMLARKA
jgi:SAM-dependent methyltransferase